MNHPLRADRLHIRPVRRADERVVREFFDRLSPRTRYLRFLSPMPTLPDSIFSQIIADDDRRVALLAEVETATGAEIVAIGNFGAIDERGGEVALVVGDRWQRQGIGTAVARRVLRAAHARGFTRFVAHALWENRAIRKLLRHVGDIVSAETRHGVSGISFIRRRRRVGTTMH
jgi:RimJ/RimL family protein N-acetyltransferase